MTTATAPHAPAVDVLTLRVALEQALAFASAHHGRVATYDAGALHDALVQLETVQDALAEAEAAVGGRADGAEWVAEVEALTLFFDREWEALPERHARALMADPRLADHAHFLRVARRSAAELDDRPATDQAIARAVLRILAGSRAWT